MYHCLTPNILITLPDGEEGEEEEEECKRQAHLLYERILNQMRILGKDRKKKRKMTLSEISCDGFGQTAVREEKVRGEEK